MSEDLRSTLNAFLYRTGESSRKYGFLTCHTLIKRGCIIKVTAFGWKREPKSPGNEVALNWPLLPLQKVPWQTIMPFVCHPKILHNHCLQFCLGVKMAPRETENNADVIDSRTAWLAAQNWIGDAVCVPNAIIKQNNVKPSRTGTE